MPRKTLTSLVLFLALGFPLFTPLTAQTSYRYAYLAIPENGDPQIRAVPPTNVATSTLLQTLQIPSDRLPPSQVIVSPSGDWAVFPLPSSVSTGEALLMRLVNLASGEVRDIGTGYPVVDSFNVLMSQQSIIWSPDGRYLALNLLPDSDVDKDLEVFIYSVADNLLVNATNDQLNQTHVAWSPDAARLVTRTDDCSVLTQNNFCSHMLEVISVADNSRLMSLQLSNPTLGSVVFDASACELRWSPDANSIGFVSSCTDGTQIPRGVYIWDLTQDTVVQATSFTPQITGQGIPDFQGWYKPFWYDADTLLIGTTYQIPPESFISQTILYESTGDTTTMLPLEMIQELALNPVTNQIAARTLSPTAVSQGENTGVSVNVFTLDPVNAASVDVATLANIPPMGCDLAWSPDGAFLAYTITPSGNCQDVVQSIVFVDATTSSVQQHTPLLEDATAPSAAVPIGWIAG